jgi:PhnB protein
MPAAMNDLVLHSALVNDGLTIMGTDMTREQLVNGNTIYLCFNCDTAEELRHHFKNLSAGGTVIDPVAEMFWGVFGSMVDKYGVKWMFNYTKINN